MIIQVTLSEIVFDSMQFNSPELSQLRFSDVGVGTCDFIKLEN